ncbi:hypothetical protein HK102_002929 [Quaeritorhiza haematococci]|nr:hypothetical protein HK102_002929 [Quaeritorhiza haematococci]
MSNLPSDIAKGNIRTPELPEIHQPSENKSRTEQAAAGLSTLSSRVDPFPHYVVAGLCGAGGVWAYSLKNPNAALAAGGLAALFTYAGAKLNRGEVRAGYDVGSVASLALLALTGPRAYRTKDAYYVAMASLGGVSSVGNMLKSYQVRTGKPKDLEIHMRRH